MVNVSQSPSQETPPVPRPAGDRSSRPGRRPDGCRRSPGPAAGESSAARPTPPVNSNSPSAASASASAPASAAHHFLRGSVGSPVRHPGPGSTPLPERAPRLRGADVTGAPRAGSRDRGGRTPALPRSLPSGLAPGRSSANRRRALLPASVGRVAERKRGQHSPRAATRHLPIHGPDGGARCAGIDGLTAGGGSGRRLPGPASEAAPQPRPVRGGRKSGKQGRGPGTLSPAPRPRPPSPRARSRLAWPRPLSVDALPGLGRTPGRPLPAFASSPRPPPVPRRACAPPAPSVAPAFAGTRALCFPLRDSPSCEPAGLPASRTKTQGPECCCLEKPRDPRGLLKRR